MLKFLKQGKRRLLTILLLMVLVFPGAAESRQPELWEPVGVVMDTAAAYIGEFSNISVREATVVPVLQELYFAQDGVIDEIGAVVGQQVSAGDMLISLDQKGLNEQAEALQKQIEQIRTNGEFEDEIGALDLSILQVELKALLGQSPLDEDAVALKRLDIEELQLNLAYAAKLRDMKLGRLEDQLEELNGQLKDKVLRAPFDGTVIYAIQETNGSPVRAYAPVMYLADESRLVIETDYISESQLQSCHDIYVLAGDSRYEIKPIPMDASEHASALLAGETASMQFEILNPDEKLEAGMYAALCMERGYIENALLIPSNALYMDGTGHYVYVVEGDDRVRRSVTTGAVNDWLTQIKSGLEEGEIVYVKE